jgi:hypothetical protein
MAREIAMKTMEHTNLNIFFLRSFSTCSSKLRPGGNSSRKDNDLFYLKIKEARITQRRGPAETGTSCSV